MALQGVCQVKGCSNQIHLNETLTQISNVDALNWHKVPSNAVVRQLWEQLIEGISSKSHVCSTHFVDGKPTAENPYPTLLLDGGETPEEVSRVNKIIEKWKQQHPEEHRTFIAEHFKSNKTGQKSMTNASPAKRTRLVEHSPSQNSCTPSKRTKLMRNDSTPTSSPVRRTRSTEGSEVQDATIAVQRNGVREGDPALNAKSTKEKPKDSDTSYKISSVGIKTKLSANTDNSSSSNMLEQNHNSGVPINRMKLSHNSSQENNSVGDEKQVNVSDKPTAVASIKDNKSDNKKAVILQPEGKAFKKTSSEASKSRSDDQKQNTSQTVAKNSRTTNGKHTEMDKPPQLELQGSLPSPAKKEKVMPKLKIYDDLKELQELLDETFQSNQKQVEVGLRPVDIENADELKQRILKMSDYPRVLVNRFPLPEGFNYNIKDVYVDVTSLSPAKKSKPSSSKHVATKSNHKLDENTKEEVPLMLEVDEEISIKVAGGGGCDVKETETDTAPEILPPSIDAKSSVDEELPHEAKPSVDEELLFDEDLKEKPNCPDCETHMKHIANITDQMNMLKRQIKQVIGTLKSNTTTNQKLSYELKMAREENKKLMSQNAVFRNKIQSISSNAGHLVKTNDGRFFRLTPKAQLQNQHIAQVGSQQSQTFSHMMQQPQPTLSLIPGSDASKPSQMILRIGQANPGVVHATHASSLVASQPINVQSQQPAGPVTVVQPSSVVQPRFNMVVQGRSMPGDNLTLQPVITQMHSPVNGQLTTNNVVPTQQIQLNPANVLQQVLSGKPASAGSQVTIAPMQNAQIQVAKTNVTPVVPNVVSQLQSTPVGRSSVVTSQPGSQACKTTQPLSVASGSQNQGNKSIVVQYHNHTEGAVQQLKQHVSLQHSTPSSYQSDQRKMPPPLKAHTSTMPPLCTIPGQMPRVQQGNKSTSGHCKMCTYLAREVTRLSKKVQTLNKDFEILDKVNQRLIKLFEPASPAFCAFIGVEQIKR